MGRWNHAASGLGGLALRRLLAGRRRRAVLVGSLTLVLVAVVPTMAYQLLSVGSYQVESGSVTEPATTVADTTASGNQAVRFAPPTIQLAAWPDETNTGVAGCPALTTYNGTMNVSTPGTVIENRLINGQLRILANNVTVRCVKVVDTGMFPVDTERDDFTSASDVVLERVEVDCGGSAANHAGMLLFGATIRQGRVYGCMDAYRFSGDVLIEDSLCHNLSSQHADPHYDCSQTGGGDNVIIRHNTFIGRDTSNILLKSDLGTIDNVLVENNLFLGTPGYMVYNVAGAYPVPTNVRFINNRFGRDYGYGPCSFESPAPTWQGNVWHDTDAAIPLNCVD